MPLIILTYGIKKENQTEYEMSENYGPQYDWLIHKKHSLYGVK
jgi:hypothetical protein